MRLMMIKYNPKGICQGKAKCYQILFNKVKAIVLDTMKSSNEQIDLNRAHWASNLFKFVAHKIVMLDWFTSPKLSSWPLLYLSTKPFHMARYKFMIVILFLEHKVIIGNPNLLQSDAPNQVPYIIDLYKVDLSTKI